MKIGCWNVDRFRFKEVGYWPELNRHLVTIESEDFSRGRMVNAEAVPHCDTFILLGWLDSDNLVQDIMTRPFSNLMMVASHYEARANGYWWMGYHTCPQTSLENFQYAPIQPVYAAALPGWWLPPMFEVTYRDNADMFKIEYYNRALIKTDGWHVAHDVYFDPTHVTGIRTHSNIES